jgi:hypothetical protein
VRSTEELAALAEQRRLDGLFRDIFEVDRRGIEIFEILYRRFASKAKVHTAGGIDAVLKTYQDAAHREVIEFIVAACNRAGGVNDSPNHPGENDDD